MPYEPRFPFYDHQATALRRAWRRPGYGFLMEMGTGKSKVIIDEFCMLHEHADAVDAVVIFAPKGTYGNWVRKELPTHLPERLSESVRAHLWTGGHTRREKEALEELLKARLPVLVVNIEAISASDRAVEVVCSFIDAFQSVYIAVDESSTIKNPQARRTKNLLKITRRPSVRWRRIATGTPVPRGPLDLWSQFEFLAPGCLGHRSFFAFRNTYAVVQKKEFGGRKVDIVVGYRGVEKLSERVAEHAYVVRKEECLTLPPKIYTTRDVELTPEQERMYAEMRQWCATEISEGRFSSATAVITQLLRLHQIVCGHLVDEEGGIHDLPNRRTDALGEILDESDGPMITWCSYRHNIPTVVSYLRNRGRRVVEYHGGTSADERSLAIWRFQGEGNPSDPLWRWGPDGIVPEAERADDFVGTPAAGGLGITLTRARTVVYYSNSPDLEKRLQSEDRAHRIGQTNSVLYVDLIARGTIEEKIVELLQRKQQMADIIMSGPEGLRSLLEL